MRATAERHPLEENLRRYGVPMDTSMLEARAAARITTIAILGVVLLSGPLVPFVDVTPAAPSIPSDSPASASITVVSPPSDDFRIASARFGAGIYLYSAPLTVRVERVSGSPTLIYELRIDDLGVTFVSVAFLSEADAGTDQVLQIERSTIEPDRITKETYTGAVELRLRTGNETRLIHQQHVAVTVEDVDAD